MNKRKRGEAPRSYQLKTEPRLFSRDPPIEAAVAGKWRLPHTRETRFLIKQLSLLGPIRLRHPKRPFVTRRRKFHEMCRAAVTFSSRVAHYISSLLSSGFIILSVRLAWPSILLYPISRRAFSLHLSGSPCLLGSLSLPVPRPPPSRAAEAAAVDSIVRPGREGEGGVVVVGLGEWRTREYGRLCSGGNKRKRERERERVSERAKLTTRVTAARGVDPK
jgi:hypothetical protein